MKIVPCGTFLFLDDTDIIQPGDLCRAITPDYYTSHITFEYPPNVYWQKVEEYMPFWIGRQKCDIVRELFDIEVIRTFNVGD